ncbi:oxidoreductase [Denitromonas sp.]|uniref:oxidoreductase n=1 Tax=Denitromonas sp. TaxID=2734609 RepID=UPI003A862E3E
MNTDTWDAELLAGLKALAVSAFPKRCANCGRAYPDEASYLNEALPISAANSGLKSSEDDDGSSIVEPFRNCACGSTLLDFFSDRRDDSVAGERRRARFDELLTYLTERGMRANEARRELRKVMRGEPSAALCRFRLPI